MDIRVTVIGHPAATAVLEQAGCDVDRNVCSKTVDLVIVAVSAQESPVWSMTNPLGLTADCEAKAAAILLTEVEGVDQELVELLEMETRLELDSKVLLYPVASEFPVWRSDDPELPRNIAAVERSSPHPIRFLAPPRPVSVDFRQGSSGVLRAAQVAARFAFAEGSRVTFSDTLEVSLDCCICRRCFRTVILTRGNVEGICTPTGHPFPGKIVGLEAGANSVIYRLEYLFEQFEDAKYPGRRTPQDRPTWGRVGFEITCPNCGHKTPHSTQTNIVRPWTCRCECGQVLYTETDEMPVLS
jgi:hypothetical protein